MHLRDRRVRREGQRPVLPAELTASALTPAPFARTKRLQAALDQAQAAGELVIQGHVKAFLMEQRELDPGF